MNIYFVHHNSTLPGPFAITDENREKIIEIGDICICEDEEGYKFLLVQSLGETWAATSRKVGYVEGKCTEHGNCLVLAFDGRTRRKGNVPFLQEFHDRCTEGALKRFLFNAIQLLTYKCDNWNITEFIELFAPVVVPEAQPVEEPTTASPCRTVFPDYLDTASYAHLQQLLASGQGLRAAYTELKKRYPKEFRKAFIAFLQEHPDSSIYDSIVDVLSESSEAFVPVAPAVDLDKLRSVFDRTSASYKFFYFFAILTLIKDGQQRFIHNEALLLRMCALAWPYAVYDRLNLGTLDQLGQTLNRLRERTDAPTFTSYSDCEHFVQVVAPNGRAVYLQQLQFLLDNVPYRFLSPWIRYDYDAGVVEKSRMAQYGAPYALKENGIELYPQWFDYFKDHYEEVYRFAYNAFKDYVRRKNRNRDIEEMGYGLGW